MNVRVISHALSVCVHVSFSSVQAKLFLCNMSGERDRACFTVAPPFTGGSL